MRRDMCVVKLKTVKLNGIFHDPRDPELVVTAQLNLNSAHVGG